MAHSNMNPVPLFGSGNQERGQGKTEGGVPFNCQYSSGGKMHRRTGSGFRVGRTARTGLDERGKGSML